MPPLIIDRAVYLSHSGRDKSIPYRIYFGNKPPPGSNREGVPAWQKSLAEFAAWGGKEGQKIFRRGVYLAENTSQAPSVEFVPYRGQIMHAGDCKNLSKSPAGDF